MINSVSKSIALDIEALPTGQVFGKVPQHLIAECIFAQYFNDSDQGTIALSCKTMRLLIHQARINGNWVFREISNQKYRDDFRRHCTYLRAVQKTTSYSQLILCKLSRITRLTWNVDVFKHDYLSPCEQLPKMFSLNIQDSEEVEQDSKEHKIVIERRLSLIKACRNLQILKLPSSANSREVSSLCSFSQNLREILLSAQVTDEALKAIAGSCHRLETITITNGQNITQEGFHAIASLHSLCSINIWGASSLDDNVLSTLAMNNKGLREVLLYSETQITSVGVLYLAQRCAQLQKVYFSNAINVSEEALTTLSHCKQLQELTLWNAAHITDRPIVAIAENCTNFSILSIDSELLTYVSLEALKKNAHFMKLYLSRGDIISDVALGVIKSPSMSFERHRCGALIVNFR